MAEAMIVDETVAEPFMPHLTLNRTDLDRLYPSVTVPLAVDANGGNDLEDATLNEGLKHAKGLVRACAEQDRTWRLVSKQVGVTPGSSAVTHDWHRRGTRNGLTWLKPSVGLTVASVVADLRHCYLW